MVCVPLQLGPQVIQPRELRIRDDRQRGIVAALDQQEDKVVHAERDIAQHIGPGWFRTSFHQPVDGGLHGLGALTADEAARPATGRRQLRTSAPTMNSKGRAECTRSALDHGTEQDGRAQDPGRSPIGDQQGNDVWPTERVVALKAGPKPQVKNALGDGGIQHAPLRTCPDVADRATTRLDGGSQANVD